VELVRRKLASSRTEAQRAIDAGLVRVGTNTEPKASTLVAADEPVHLESAPEPFVSRAGRKLDAAFDAFAVDPGGKSVIDVGASTGGFTDCALQRGADHVVAVDVGYGQMHWDVRSDDRVTVVERTNIRTADPGSLGAPFDLVVGDLSFISLAMISRQLTALGSVDADWLLLAKPQFEAGKDGVGKGGIVRDPLVRIATIRSVSDAFAGHGLSLHGLIVSPITGATGNVEYVAWFRHGEPERDVATLIAALEETAP
jgi:23S rRNA (cytidine1920-2'-O)/16S rRNA (cytidine1409-2'-O)-methyltransferase